MESIGGGVDTAASTVASLVAVAILGPRFLEVLKEEEAAIFLEVVIVAAD